MNPKHSNPMQSRRVARAPYNFVPLAERVVPARDPLDQDKYHQGALTGRLECELETCSPTYIRGLLSEADFRSLGNKKPDELGRDDKEKRAPFYSATRELVEGRAKPAIPGSSLRGLIRTLVEITAYGRMRWVGKKPTFTFRAVAAARDDPLRDPYQQALGRFGSNVRAGYLHKSGDDWYVRPALMPEALRLPEKGAYLKVKEHRIQPRDIPGYIRFSSPDYHPQLHEVSFEAEALPGKRGQFVSVRRIGPPSAGYTHHGVLVCSGNMTESKKGSKSPRMTHALVLAPDGNAKQLKIRPQAVEDYLAGMTPFQEQELKAWGGPGQGCLKEGAPVFYVTEGDEVVYFGHSPNFRIPARLLGAQRAATPPDFVPADLRADPRPDLADAIFGWVEEPEAGLTGQRAGRVFFGDATFVSSRDGVWLRPEPIPPHTLSGPKPTTFQHYLVQDRELGHDPDSKARLAHYGTSPEETRLRGHKQYWHKGSSPDIEATAREREHESQLTAIVPLKPGVRFSFSIHFENLRPEELGALWWALNLPGQAGRTYRHKLGMGKPLGMGAIAITSKLYLSDRQARYAHLFQGLGWAAATASAEGEQYLKAFEIFVLKENAVAPDKEHLAQVERIRMLLTMLEWREGDPAWLEATRYMEIERLPDNLNEYKERPVLPDPLVVAGGAAAAVRPVHRVDRTPPSAQRQPSGLLAANQRGKVKWFNEAKGYGFIVAEDGTEVFVHRTGIAVLEGAPLRQGQRVTYDLVKGIKGPQARNVRLAP